MNKLLLFVFSVLCIHLTYSQTEKSTKTESCCAVTADGGGRCTGSAYCSACTNCSGCKHCNSGGSCGVCASNSRSYSTPKSYKSSSSSGIGKSSGSVSNGSSDNSGSSSGTFNGIVTQYRSVISEVLNLRSGPGTNYSIVEKLAKYQFVEILSETGDWVKVKVVKTGSTGYLHKDYLR